MRHESLYYFDNIIHTVYMSPDNTCFYVLSIIIIITGVNFQCVTPWHRNTLKTCIVMMVRSIGSTEMSSFLKTFKWQTNQIFSNYNKELFQREIVLRFQVCWSGTLNLSYLWRLFILPISMDRDNLLFFPSVENLCCATQP